MDILRKGAVMGQEDKDFDLQKIKELTELMKIHNLVELEIAHGEDGILLKRVDAQQLIAKMPISSPPIEEELEIINSPIKGTFYASVNPDSEPFVEVDSKVTSQTPVCIIEAMKVMNEIKAETTGQIVEILVKNGQAVEEGQPLFKIRPEQ